MHAQDGVLLDISQSGACFRVFIPQPANQPVAFVLRWKQESILLRGRIVRSVMHRRPSEAEATLARIEHRVSVEFQQLPPHSVDQVRRLTESVH
jgi:hypothetical protein